MARVDGDAHVRLVIDAVDDGRQLLEVSPAFGALARHRLQQHHDARLQPEHAVEAVADQRASAIGPLPHVRAGMDVDVYLLPGLTDRRQQSDVLGERPYGELALVGILAGEVVDVGSVDDERAVMLGRQLPRECVGLGRVERLGWPPVRRAREERECGAVFLMRAFQQRTPPACRGQVRSDIQFLHPCCPFIRIVSRRWFPAVVAGRRRFHFAAVASSR